MVSCGDSVVCFLESFCLDRPTTLLTGLLALVIGVSGSRKIMKNTASNTTFLYSLLWLTFATMMTISGTLHSIIRDSPVKGESPFIGTLRIVMSFVNVWFTSSIGIGFGVAGIADLARKNLLVIYLVLKFALFILWLYNFIFHLGLNFYLYVIPVSVGCLVFLLCQIVLYSRAQKAINYPKGASQFKKKWLALVETVEQEGRKVFVYHPAKAVFTNLYGAVVSEALCADTLRTMEKSANENKAMMQFYGAPSFPYGSYNSGIQNTQAYYGVPNTSVPPHMNSSYQSSSNQIPAPQTMYSQAPFQPASQEYSYQSNYHIPQQAMVPPVYPNPMYPIDPSSPVNGPYLTPLEMSQDALPYVDMEQKKAYLPGFLYFLLGGISGFIGLLFFIPLAQFWCSVVGKELGAWIGPEFIWFIGSDFAMYFLMKYLIESDSIRHNVQPFVVGPYNPPREYTPL